MSTTAAINIVLEAFAFAVSFIILISLILNNVKDKLNKLFLWVISFNGIVLFCDIINWIFDGSTTPHTKLILWISNFFVITLCLPGTAIYTDYLVTYISRRTKISKKIVPTMYGFYIAAILITAIAQFNNLCFYIDENNFYRRNDFFWIPYAMPAITFILTTFLILRYRNKLGIKDAIAFSSCIVLPVLAIIFQLQFYGLLPIYIVNTVAWLIIYVRIHLEQSRQLMQNELELANSRIDIMLSQIQPHFLYNSLDTIETLCTKDGRQAAELVRSFATYLRENMDSLTQKELVPFERELAHVKTYLEIEKKRFGERLQVSYDLETIDFAVPTLTIQPIVEHAVCHEGLEKAEVGRVMLATRLIPNGVQIIVSDNSRGYLENEISRPHQPIRDEFSHVGFENVKNRLTAQCGGFLTVESTTSMGTVVTITIPNVRSLRRNDMNPNSRQEG